MDKIEEEKIRKTFSGNYLDEYEIKGKSLLHRCCNSKMIKLLDENCTTRNRKLIYCPTCKHIERPYHIELMTVPETL
jgi:hypothetical protein